MGKLKQCHITMFQVCEPAAKTFPSAHDEKTIHICGLHEGMEETFTCSLAEFRQQDRQAYTHQCA